MRIGYASGTVSKIDTQIATLKAADCDTVHAEGQDGASALDALFDYTIAEGDVLVVTQFDRVAGSFSELQSIAGRLAEYGAHLAVADERVDTADPDNRELFRAILAVADTA